jgi:heavy metal efflux system protein
VAEVQTGTEVRSGAMIKNGHTEAVGGVVLMSSGGNAKKIVSRVKERVAEINGKHMIPGGLRIVPYYDRSQLVDAAIHTVTEVLGEGIVLVIIILFLGDVRSSLIVCATLILTPLLTFLIMNKIGLSANLMSLGGLAIAIGLMVDGSVVVVENVFSRLSHAHHTGHDPTSMGDRLKLTLAAVAEVANPVVFGVTIIIVVFLPLMTLEGMEGKMFSPLANTVAIALGISLILSLTIFSCALCVSAERWFGGRHVDGEADPTSLQPASSLGIGTQKNNGRRCYLAIHPRVVPLPIPGYGVHSGDAGRHALT